MGKRRELEVPAGVPVPMLVARANGWRGVTPAVSGGPGLVGASAAWCEVRCRIAELAASHGHILITGERGVGKRRVAEAIAEERRLVAQVFDAGTARTVGSLGWLRNLAGGLRRLGDGALVVITHLERLDASALLALGRVLKGGPVPTVATAVRPERRAPAATEGLDRLGVFTGRVHLLPLRHRPEDVAPLARHFDARHGAGRLVWTDEALAALAGYLWPGNVKELERVVQGLVLQSPERTIAPDRLPEELRRGVRRRPLTRLEEAEVDVILAALAEADGNKDLAAGLIGIHRATLYRKLQNYGLDWHPET